MMFVLKNIKFLTGFKRAFLQGKRENAKEKKRERD